MSRRRFVKTSEVQSQHFLSRTHIPENTLFHSHFFKHRSFFAQASRMDGEFQQSERSGQLVRIRGNNRILRVCISPISTYFVFWTNVWEGL